MKNDRFEYLIEGLAAEPHSPDYDSVFSSMIELDSRVREMSKKHGLSAEKIYGAIDVDPKIFFAEYLKDKATGNDKEENLYNDALRFYYPDVMEKLDDLEKQLVPVEHNKYGGISKTAPKHIREMTTFGAAMIVLMAPPPKNILGGKAVSDSGVPAHKTEELPIKKAFDVIDYIMGGVIKHKKALAFGTVAALVGLYASNAIVNANKEEHGDATDAGISKVKAEIGVAGGAEGLLEVGGNGSDNVTIRMPNGISYDKNGREIKATPKPTPTPHQFTPDMKVFGSENYQKKVQEYLEDIKKTPDTFRINGMTAHEYVTYYIDELYEGEEEKYIDIGIEQYPLKIIDASNLMHIARHIEQGQNKTFLDKMHKWDEKIKGEKRSFFHEHDAIKLQTAWEKARYNSTDEQVKEGFLQKMRYYTKDPKYFEDELSVD
ncbi:MAG: hypothetical protein ABIF85_04820 [Nanoarchaeota archaeon]|nr:hypothetical protein [Nanoarchaeota archaeon]MBU4451659.1 hypothetical protein [Nanoarchaeota archaeon]MCG2724574.1 hypothetical protein [archaeon]